MKKTIIYKVKTWNVHKKSDKTLTNLSPELQNILVSEIACQSEYFDFIVFVEISSSADSLMKLIIDKLKILNKHNDYVYTDVSVDMPFKEFKTQNRDIIDKNIHSL